MPLLASAYSSLNRPVLHGTLGAVSATHPLAVAAGQEILLAGGSTVDATPLARVLAPAISALPAPAFASIAD